MITLLPLYHDLQYSMRSSVQVKIKIKSDHYKKTMTTRIVSTSAYEKNKLVDDETLLVLDKCLLDAT